MRLFFALWPPRETALALERWAKPLGGRCTAAQKIHLTLAFLGEASPERAVLAARRVQAPLFDLPVDDARYWIHNRIVWVGPREMPPALALLAESLQLELYRESFMLERRSFAAHVTLLRKAPEQLLPPLPRLVEWPVNEFALVHSSGGRYETLERFRLG